MSFTIYEVLLPEPNDGRGSVPGGFFSNVVAAKRRATDGNVCGCPTNGDVREVTVYGTYEEFERGRSDAVKARALAKLTAEERNALGL